MLILGVNNCSLTIEERRLRTMESRVLPVLFTTIPKSLSPSMFTRGPGFSKSRVTHEMSVTKALSAVRLVVKFAERLRPLI